ncbi:hypothetical protein [Streptomyces sp. 7N604]|uniref:hypothetical protein n=1 Tax=Streptomyces sp. 7N604 TaxID=3457415 RepID=UPI003FD4E2CA
MRRIAALASTAAAAALAALLTLLTCSTPAVAGGPTSVLITSPTTEEATALLVDSERYRRLESLLGPPAGEQRRPPKLDENGGASGRQINVSWMIHDVSVWRTDGIYPDAETGEVWIQTVANGRDGRGGRYSARKSGPDSGFWHAAEKPEELLALLSDLGVLGKEGPARGMSGAAGERTAPAAASHPSADAVDGWWSLPGFAAGIGIGCGGTVLIRRWLIRRTVAEPGPRRQVLDV